MAARWESSDSELYAYVGERPTSYETSGGEPIPGTGSNRKMFYRAGVSGDFFLHKLEFLPFYLHGNDNAYLASSTPNNQPLLDGARDASWNGGFLETHYYINQQFVLLQRVEAIRMSQQAFPDMPSTLGNVDAYTVRHALVSVHVQPGRSRGARRVLTREDRRVPGQLPSEGSTVNIWTSSLLFAFDFDF